MSEKSPRAADAAPALLSVAEASARLGTFSEMTILRRLQSGEWPGGLSGRKWHISRAFIDALAAAIGSTPHVIVEDFARQWMTRRAAETAGEVA